MNDGRLAPEVEARHAEEAVALGLNRMDVPKSHGGLGLSVKEQVAIWEQLGRGTNMLTWCFQEPEEWMFEACTDAQIEKYIMPLVRGEKTVCYAITEEGPGSDVAGIKATAHFGNESYRLNGDKWFVTDANQADFFIFQAGIVDGPDEGEQALFFVDVDAPGIEILKTPRFSHTFISHHPTYRFSDVVIPQENRLGKSGDNLTYTQSWFRRERLMIAARCCGAAARLIDDAMSFAKDRIIDGYPLAERDSVQFVLADCATELHAARLMTFDAADAHDRGENVKILHARCSMAKLYASEMANRVADKVVQILGGRGYMRENAAERFYRELRVDRIWEGTSEIQRLIIAGRLLKYGFEGL
jgi:alkylation response protein AidB-like acyl-CoA dehydrogenase